MQSFTLRPADWEDLPAFKHIARTTLTEDISALFDPNKLLEDKKVGFEYIMAAEQNGEVVGFCCRYACRDADTPYCAEIFSLCVLPKAQHSGIGRAFVEDALAILYISGYAEKLTLEEIAGAGHVCKSACEKLFHTYLHCTPVEYLQRFRLQKAAERLCKTETPVAQIALDCGFSGASYFTGCFKKIYGCTPKAYRSSRKNTKA